MNEGKLVKPNNPEMPKKEVLEKFLKLKVDESGVHKSHYENEKKQLLAKIENFDFKKVQENERGINKSQERDLKSAKNKDERQAIFKLYDSYHEAMRLIKTLSPDLSDIENDKILENIAKADAWKFHDVKNNLLIRDDNVKNAIAWLDDAVLTLAAWKFPKEFRAQTDARTKDEISKKREELMKMKVS